MRRVDHLRIRGSSAPGEFPEQVFPDTAPRPAHEAIIDRRRRAIGFRAIAPATAALEHMYDAADDTAVVHSLLAANIRWQIRRDPFPLLVGKPKQIPAHECEILLTNESISYCLSGRINEF